MSKWKYLFVATALACGLGVAGTAAANEESDSKTLKHDRIQQLLAEYANNTPADFEDFLRQVASSSDTAAGLGDAISRYLDGENLGDADFINIARLLGIYNRLQYGDEVQALLGEMVAIPTFKSGDTPQHENPAIQRFGELVKKKADEFGLEFQNVDDRIFVVELAGSTDEAFGILTHSDVVPASEEGWTVEDGQQIDPFETTVIDGKIYGRGTEDDKASIAAALYAMKTIEENDIPLKRTIRLMIETTEETGGEGFKYYKSRHELPDYNIVLDSGYPAVTAENGFGTIDTYFPRVNADGSGPVIEEVTGGLATNQIPATSVATIRGENPDSLAQTLKEHGDAYAQQHGGDFEVSTRVENDTVEVTVTGKSAHSSKPETGINPVPRMAGLLSTADVPFQDNHYSAAMRYITDNYGLDYHGKKLDVDYRHDFMGPLNVSPTYLELEEEKLRVAVNVRAPAGERSVEELAKEIEKKLTDYAEQQDIDMQVNVAIRDWMLRDPQGEWLQTLLNIFGDTTGLPAEPISSAGSTTAKLLPNAVNFGPSMPGEPYTGHTSNEFKRIDNLLLDIQMFTEMMARIGNQERLD